MAEKWDSTVGLNGDLHFMQSWAWGEQSAQSGWNVLRKELVLESGKGIGSAQVLVRDIRPGLPWKLAYIPGGPNLDWEDSSQAFLFLEQLEKMLRQEKVTLMWMAPPLLRDRAKGLTMLTRLEDSGWHFCRNSWLQPDRVVSLLTKPFETVQVPANGVLKGSHMGSEQDQGAILFGDKADFDRHFGPSNSSGTFTLEAAELRFCRELMAYPQPEDTRDSVRPTSAYIVAEGPHNKLEGAALLVSWRRRAWYFAVPSGQDSPSDWAAEGLRRKAATWALAQGCTYLDWGPAEAKWTDMQQLTGLREIETCSLNPFIGTWGRLLWPLPDRVSPTVQKILEGLISPVPPINGHLPV